MLQYLRILDVLCRIILIIDLALKYNIFLYHCKLRFIYIYFEFLANEDYILFVQWFFADTCTQIVYNHTDDILFLFFQFFYIYQ